MVRRIGSGCAVACALLVSPLPAIAKDEPFGTPGQVVIRNVFANALVVDHYDGAGPDAMTMTSIALKPGADMFVLPGFSVGAHIGYARTWTSAPSYDFTQDDLLWGPTLGYAWNLGERLSLWPMVGADFIVSWRHGNSGYETDEPIKRVSYSASLPLLFHVVPHFFVGFGPSIGAYSTSFAGSERSTRLTASTLIGGWF